MLVCSLCRARWQRWNLQRCNALNVSPQLHNPLPLPFHPMATAPVRTQLLTTSATLLNGIRKDLPPMARPFLPVALAKLESMTEAQAVEMARAIIAFGDTLRPHLPESQ